MAFAQALAIGLIALIVAPGYAFYFDVTPKSAVLLVGTAGLLILAARGREAPRGPRLFATLLLWNAASLAVSTAFSPNRSLSLYGGTWRCFGAAMQCVAMLFAWLVAWQSTGRPGRVRTVLRGVSVAGSLAAGYAIAQYRVGSAVRPAGTLGDAGYLANWLSMAVFLGLALAQMETHRVWRGVAYAAAALALAGVFVTGARTAMFGLAAGVLVWLGCGGFRRPRRVLLAAAAVVLCGAAFWFSPGDPGAGAHPRLWRDALSMAAERPLAGYGPEVFLAGFPHFESKALARADPDLVYESPRNILLDALVSQGVPGLLLLCGLCWAGFAAAWRRKAGWLAAALAAGIVSQQFTAFIMPTAVLFLTVIALAAALAKEPEAPRPSPAIAAAVPFFALALVYFALRLTMADHALAVTRRLLDAREWRATTAEYETYWFWRLPGSSADLWYSRSWMEVARSTADPAVRAQALAISKEAAGRATEDAEEPFVAWYNRAQVCALEDNAEDAEASLRRAIAARPNWYLPHWILAQELLRESRWDAARTEAALAVELDACHHPEVTTTLLLP